MRAAESMWSCEIVMAETRQLAEGGIGIRAVRRERVCAVKHGNAD